jgi:hypothetical protein
MEVRIFNSLNEGALMKTARTNEKKEIATLGVYSMLIFVAMSHVGYCGPSSKGPEKILKKVEQSVSSEKIKEKFHEAADSIDKKKVHETIDIAADYLDPEKLKSGVDEIADYLDRDKIKEFVDYAADHLDKDKIKGMIDAVAEVLDREKIKGAVDEIASSIDVEQIKDTFDESVDEIAATLQDATHNLEDEIRHLGSNNNAIRQTVKRYNWNQWIPDQAAYGPATLSNLKLGGAKKAIVARPGQQIEGEVVCNLDRKRCSALSLYRVVLGIKDHGGQTTVFNHFGLRAGKETDHFTLVAPKEKGVYQVGFRVVEAAREGTAIQSWDDRDENGWGEPVVIGLIIVA